MKKLNRKLIPAFAMLLLSAVLMSTASFAWFSANGTVSASGMSIKATSPAALWIQNGNGKWDVTASFTNTKSGISPVTIDIAGTANNAAAAENWSFHALNADGRALIGPDGLIGGAPVTTDTIDGKKIATAEPKAADSTYANANYIKQDFLLRLDGTKGEDTAKISVNATISTAEEKLDTIWKALRVAVVSAGTTNGSTGGYVVFAPSKLTNPTLSDETALTLDDAAVVAGNVEFLTIVAQDDVPVYVYVWYEGNDKNCTNDDAKLGIAYSVSLKFFTEDTAFTG